MSPRRLAMEEARRSKRPSRADRPAGTSLEPDHRLDDAGLERLLAGILEAARTAGSPAKSAELILTMGGRLEPDIARRSLTRTEAAALRLLTAPGRRPLDADEDPAFTSAFALGPHGRLMVTVPGRRVLPADAAATGVALRVPWRSEELAAFTAEALAASDADRAEAADCRALLDGLGVEGRAKAVATVRAAVFLIPPVLLYQGDDVYSNLRGQGNLTGKTLLPTHPACFLHLLEKLPLPLWSDAECVVVTCLWLLHSSGGPNRIESLNGCQLSLDHVAEDLRTACAVYRAAAPETVDELPADIDATAEGLLDAATAMASVRARMVEQRRLYYEINATVRRKAERAMPVFSGPTPEEREVCAGLGALLPRPADGFAEAVTGLRSERDWLSTPVGGEPTGFEALIRSTVTSAVAVFDADYAMSRGLRSLPRLLDALARRDYAEVVSWELPSFYCCVVPGTRPGEWAGGDLSQVADSAWAISARMQYNTWHVMPGNLPKEREVQARDFLAPHALPDLAVHSDLHHRGHVAHGIRFSARSPEPVRIGDYVFKSLTDLRVMRCAGEPFDTTQLVGVARTARFLAQVSELVVEIAAEGRPIEVTSFDHRWHRRTVINEAGEH